MSGSKRCWPSKGILPRPVRPPLLSIETWDDRDAMGRRGQKQRGVRSLSSVFQSEHELGLEMYVDRQMCNETARPTEEGLVTFTTRYSLIESIIAGERVYVLLNQKPHNSRHTRTNLNQSKHSLSLSLSDLEPSYSSSGLSHSLSTGTSAGPSSPSSHGQASIDLRPPTHKTASQLSPHTAAAFSPTAGEGEKIAASKAPSPTPAIPLFVKGPGNAVSRRIPVSSVSDRGTGAGIGDGVGGGIGSGGKPTQPLQRIPASSRFLSLGSEKIGNEGDEGKKRPRATNPFLEMNNDTNLNTMNTTVASNTSNTRLRSSPPPMLASSTVSASSSSATLATITTTTAVNTPVAVAVAVLGKGKPPSSSSSSSSSSTIRKREDDPFATLLGSLNPPIAKRERPATEHKEQKREAPFPPHPSIADTSGACSMRSSSARMLAITQQQQGLLLLGQPGPISTASSSSSTTYSSPTPSVPSAASTTSTVGPARPFTQARGKTDKAAKATSETGGGQNLLSEASKDQGAPAGLDEFLGSFM